MRRLLSLSTAFLCLCTACHQQIYYGDIQSIEKEKWHVDSPLVFKVNITDTLAYYDMYIDLRNSTDFETQNFYVFMQTTYPDGYTTQDTLGFTLCDKFGKWTGKGHGCLKDNKFLFQPKVRFPQQGTYTFTVYQGMRTNEVHGIADFGIILGYSIY